MGIYEKLVKDVIKVEYMACVHKDELWLYEQHDMDIRLKGMIEDAYNEYMERDDCTTIFDIEKIFIERGWF